MSVPPPGVNGTMMVTARVGHAGVCACAAKARVAAATVAAIRAIFNMGVS
jgi:hypothetical protein